MDGDTGGSSGGSSGVKPALGWVPVTDVSPSQHMGKVFDSGNYTDYLRITIDESGLQEVTMACGDAIYDVYKDGEVKFDIPLFSYSNEDVDFQSGLLKAEDIHGEIKITDIMEVPDIRPDAE